MANLFAYGTLMCEDIMLEVSGCNLIQAPGTLRGYRRQVVRDELYPALASDVKGFVEGVVYRDVPDSVWEHLDRFEGEMYSRHSVQVDLKDGTTLQAETYVVKQAFISCLDDDDWDFEAFLRDGKTRFMKSPKR